MSPSFEKQIADAQAEMATWSEEKRKNVQLEGTVPDYNREPTCRHCGCGLPCPC